jgi:hypothetical protein
MSASSDQVFCTPSADSGGSDHQQLCGFCRESIQKENQLPGSIDWQLTRVKVEAAGCRSWNIEGYCSKQSVLAGEKIDIMVSSKPARDFKLEIFRTGYYGGRGARLMQTIDRVKGSLSRNQSSVRKICTNAIGSHP